MIAKITILFAALVAVKNPGAFGAWSPHQHWGRNSARSQDVSIPLKKANKKEPTIREGVLKPLRIDGRGRRVDYVADAHGFPASLNQRTRNRRPSRCRPIASPTPDPSPPSLTRFPSCPCCCCSPPSLPQLSRWGSLGTEPPPAAPLFHTEVLMDLAGAALGLLPPLLLCIRRSYGLGLGPPWIPGPRSRIRSAYGLEGFDPLLNHPFM
ncbi:hypothetical protein TNIN_9741 [Trichonephila inaurata madagascariensis]|uniref:Uncharacterized protein n=1 Tax=Trichonephila inaurata madagascariensis TaxID=2747483 RepID=A0A8X7CKK6_9ARAC|nr:hypothetical protein TNIN_9741 [Trichonephila inaurata madagascariensis]